MLANLSTEKKLEHLQFKTTLVVEYLKAAGMTEEAKKLCGILEDGKYEENLLDLMGTSKSNKSNAIGFIAQYLQSM